MRVAVTGGNGLVGAHLVRRLEDLGHEVLALSRSHRPAKLDSIARERTYSYRSADVRDEDTLTSLFAEHDTAWVFHCAVMRWHDTDKLRPEKGEHWQTNVRGTASAMRAAARAGAQAFIHSSAMMVFDLDAHRCWAPREDTPVCPAEPNGLSVVAGEQMVRYLGRLSSLPHVILRYPGLYGPGKTAGFVATCIGHMHRRPSEPFRVRSNRHADFLWVEDVVTANLQAAQNIARVRGRTLHIGSGQTVSVREIAEKIREIMGSSTPLVEDTPLPPRDFHLDCSLARELLHYSPHDLEYGLRRTIAEWGEF